MDENKECRCPVCINHDLKEDAEAIGDARFILLLVCSHCGLKIYGGTYWITEDAPHQKKEVQEKAYKNLEDIWHALDHDFPVSYDLEEDE